MVIDVIMNSLRLRASLTFGVVRVNRHEYTQMYISPRQNKPYDEALVTHYSTVT